MVFIVMTLILPPYYTRDEMLAVVHPLALRQGIFQYKIYGNLWRNINEGGMYHWINDMHHEGIYTDWYLATRLPTLVM